MAKQRVLKGKEMTDEEIEQPSTRSTVTRIREVTAPDAHIKFRSQYDRIAADKHYYKNWYYPGGRSIFPDAKNLQFVDRYYPYAEGGPLTFDFVEKDYKKNLKLQQLMEVKREALKKAGVRHVVAWEGAQDFEIMEQLA